jgi:hypothetical protein
MNSTIEDRLAAALDARAELVRHEDLRPLEVPTTPRMGAPARAGVLLLAAAAATAAVVATPFVLDGSDGRAPEHGPAQTPSAGVSEPSEPSEPEPSKPSEASETPVVPADAIVVDRQQADVDGDGRPDRVRLLLDGPSAQDWGVGFVEASLAAGGTAVAEVPEGYPGLEPAFDLNDDGREQVLLSYTQGGDSAQLLVYTWHDGGLVLAQKEGDAPLGWEEFEGQMVGYYTDDRGLVSWLRGKSVGGSTYEVEQWSWAVDGDRLVPTPVASACFDVLTDAQPRPC